MNFPCHSGAIKYSSLLRCESEETALVLQDRCGHRRAIPGKMQLVSSVPVWDQDYLLFMVTTNKKPSRKIL